MLMIISTVVLLAKKYVDDENARQDIAINSKAEKNAVALLRAKDNIDMSNFRIYEPMLTKFKYSPVRLEKLNSPYFCI